jgi:choline dehydrogenase-like flavoprotein
LPLFDRDCKLTRRSGIGDPEVLQAAGVECVVENKGVGANFQDHVLGGLLYDLKPGVPSLDAMHGAEYAKAQQELYEKTHQGPLGSPGMVRSLHCDYIKLLITVVDDGFCILRISRHSRRAREDNRADQANLTSKDQV